MRPCCLVGLSRRGTRNAGVVLPAPFYGEDGTDEAIHLLRMTPPSCHCDDPVRAKKQSPDGFSFRLFHFFTLHFDLKYVG